MNKRQYKLFKGFFQKYSSLIEEFDVLHDHHVKLLPERKQRRTELEAQMKSLVEKMFALFT